MKSVFTAFTIGAVAGFLVATPDAARPTAPALPYPASAAVPARAQR